MDATYYDKVAGSYDTWGRLTETRAKQRMLALLSIADGQRVLDIGVGTAMLFAEIVARNPSGESVGIDISEGMLARARTKLADRKGVRLLQTDGGPLPFPDASFDRIVCSYVMELLPRESYAAFLAEIARVVRPTARVVIAGMIEPRFFLARRMVRSHPSWQGGLDGDRIVLPGFSTAARERVSQLTFVTEIVALVR